MSGIFISYRRQHTAYLVGRLHDRLGAHFGPAQIFRDVENVSGLATDYGQHIDKVVGSCDAFLAIISDHWLLNRNPAGKRPIGIERDWVQREVEVALSRPLLVVPVLVEGATMPGELELPYSIRSIAMRPSMTLSDLTMDADVEKLIEVLGEVVGPQGATTPTATGSGDAPPLPEAADGAPPPTAPPARRWFKRR